MRLVQGILYHIDQLHILLCGLSWVVHWLTSWSIHMAVRAIVVVKTSILEVTRVVFVKVATVVVIRSIVVPWRVMVLVIMLIVVITLTREVIIVSV